MCASCQRLRLAFPHLSDSRNQASPVGRDPQNSLEWLVRNIVWLSIRGDEAACRLLLVNGQFPNWRIPEMTHNAIDRQLMMEVVARYAFGYDHADFDAIGAAFTPEATSRGVWANGEIAWGPMNGRDEIVATLRAMRKGHTDRPRHVTTNFLFTEQTESSASARFYLLLNSTVDDKCAIVSAGYCDAQFARDGETWRLARLDVLLDRTH